MLRCAYHKLSMHDQQVGGSYYIWVWFVSVTMCVCVCGSCPRRCFKKSWSLCYPLVCVIMLMITCVSLSSPLRQDSCEEVRERFVEKLNKYLLSFQLPLEYLSIMVYAGTEPCKTRRDKVRASSLLLSCCLRYRILVLCCVSRVQFRKVMSANVTKRKQCLNQLSKAKGECCCEILLVVGNFIVFFVVICWCVLSVENSLAVLPEYAVPHAIYLVAHHPYFSRTTSHKLDKFKE